MSRSLPLSGLIFEISKGSCPEAPDRKPQAQRGGQTCKSPWGPHCLNHE